MSLLVPARRHDPEWMDREGNAAADLERALRDIAWVNRRLGGARALLRGIGPYLADGPAGSALEILDVGTGGGDLAAAMVEMGRALGRRVRVTALDRDPVAAAFASGQAAGNVRVVRADAAALPFPPKSFDLVTASLFLHHFRHREAAALLAAFLRLARRAVVINELRRHRLPWAFIALAARATGRGPMFVHDAPLSVLRGFTEEELLGIARDARDAHDGRGARDARGPDGADVADAADETHETDDTDDAEAPEASVTRSWPFRLLLVLPAGGRES